ncbi:MAG: AIR synthase-related protein, partial [Prosthecobacter sp.]|nr:AIR synthase-related protein [Prosthecobacter sp.]
ALHELAAIYQTEIFVLAKADGSQRLKVMHHGTTVCDLHVTALHEAPRREMRAKWRTPADVQPAVPVRPESWTATLKTLLSDFSIVSREPIIREYDHEVQGNTVLKPLAGATGDCPQDGSVIRVDGSQQLVSLACALLPEWGKTDPHLMGRAVVDECVRQLVAMGSNPDRIAILDNFCMGNPDNERELGALVECTKGMAKSAIAYGAPFVSGKDSFYNYFVTDEGPVSIPVTLLLSGFGIVEDVKHVVGASLRRVGSKIAILGKASAGLRGSIVAKYTKGIGLDAGPSFDEAESMAAYRRYFDLVKQGAILSAHDIGEGGLAVALAEMAFSGKAGLRITTDKMPAHAGLTTAELLFGETPGRLLVEIAPEHVSAATAAGLTIIGEAHRDPYLYISHNGTTLIDSPIDQLKPLWKDGLVKYY